MIDDKKHLFSCPDGINTKLPISPPIWENKIDIDKILKADEALKYAAPETTSTISSEKHIIPSTAGINSSAVDRPLYSIKFLTWE